MLRQLKFMYFPTLCWRFTKNGSLLAAVAPGGITVLLWKQCAVTNHGLCAALFVPL